MITTLSLLAILAVQADGLSMKFMGIAVTPKVGGYRPIRAEMDGKAEDVKKAPAELVAPKYGTLKLDEKGWKFILDEPEGKPARLFVDTNGDGDLTNDPATEWEAKTNDGLTMHRGKSQIDLGSGNLGSLGMYRFDPTDGRRAQLKNTMLFYVDFGYEVSITLDGKNFTSYVAGKPTAESDVWIDRDGNKSRSNRREVASMDKPFNFTGTTYVIKLKGDELALEKTAENLPLAPMPPDLSLGKKVVPFLATTMDGTKVEFPKSYKGKLVMLDFWATWCGPCIREIPNVKAAYAAWHDKGFEILGVTIDDAEMTERVTEFIKTHELPWKQIYEGKGWDTSLAEQYDVDGIPFVLLVDGDTGEIVGLESSLRGPEVTEFIGKALAKKNEGK